MPLGFVPGVTVSVSPLGNVLVCTTYVYACPTMAVVLGVEVTVRPLKTVSTRPGELGLVVPVAESVCVAVNVCVPFDSGLVDDATVVTVGELDPALTEPI